MIPRVNISASIARVKASGAELGEGVALSHSEGSK